LFPEQYEIGDWAERESVSTRGYFKDTESDGQGETGTHSYVDMEEGPKNSSGRRVNFEDHWSSDGGRLSRLKRVEYPSRGRLHYNPL